MDNNNLKNPVNLIGINGKIGSGKDTVGKIIQYLVNSSEHYDIHEWINSSDLNGRDFNWKIKKFAGKVKEIASILTGIPIEKFENQEFKQRQMSEDWNMTYRTFLQKLGTEAMRDGLHTNVWVNGLFADYKAMPNKTMEESFMEQFVTGRSAIRYTYPNWIITDMRFPNEIEAIVERKGITIRVNRPGISLLDHPSETSLDNAEFDYTIVNDSTIEDLVIKVREILVKEKII